MARERRLQTLETALGEIGDALQSGRISDLPGLTDRLQRCLEDGEPGGTNDARLARLRAATARNATLASAAADGIRDALRRLAEIRAATGPIESYGADGSRANIGPGRPTFEHKA